MSEHKTLTTLVGALLLRAAKQRGLVLVRALLSHPSCDLMARDEKGNTALHIAASSGHHDVVEELANKMSSIEMLQTHLQLHKLSEIEYPLIHKPVHKHISPREYPNKAGNTPLLVASKEGKTCVVKTLLSNYRANSMARNKHNNSCMHLAALHGHIPVIDLLVHEFGCSPHIKGYNSRTPLHYASGGGHVELVDKMISKYKCEKMARDIEGRTPLHMAALHGRKSVVNLLISKHECPVECTDNEGNTALLCASSRGHVSVVIMLHTEFGASVGVRNSSSNTVVHLAALNGHTQLLDLLLSKILCSPRTKGYKNRTSLHFACYSGHVKMVDMLITQYYCNLMAKDSNGLIPLHMAALNGRAEVVRLLVNKYGCPVDYTAHNGCTALLFAASMGHCNVVELLLSELGANIEACENSKNTAINLAALHGHNHLLTALNKVNTTLITDSTRSPLHQACSSGHLHVVKILISKYNCDPMAKNHEGLTPLHVAAGSGKVEVVKNLVTKYSCPVDCVDNEDNTPLHSACSSGCSDVVKLLLSKKLGAKPDSPNNSGSCAVHIAAFYGHTEVFSVLVDGFDRKLGAKGYHNRTALHYAAGGGHLEMVEKLVSKYKCDPMTRDDEGLTPIHIAAGAGMRHIVRLLVIEHNSPILTVLYSDMVIKAAACGKEDIVRVLITQCSCPVDCVDNSGCTPLIAASMGGHASTVKMLATELGANVEARDKYDQTALHYAAGKGHIHVVSVLTNELGCSPDIKGPGNVTPLHIACQYGHVDMVSNLINENKCDRMARDDNGSTPLHFAAACGMEETVSILINRYRCPVDCVNNSGYTPLMVASMKGHASTVKMLATELGADMKARDKTDNTALHIAAGKGHKDVVSVLINVLGCSPNIKGSVNLTPLHAACQYGQVDMVSILINEHKCDRMASDKNGDTPLHYAAAYGMKETVRVLISEYCCPVDCVDNSECTPLMSASIMGHTSIVEMLISELEANMAARDKKGQSALHHAALNGHKDLVSVLIDKFGCSPESKGYNGQTPLHAVCQGGKIGKAYETLTYTRNTRENIRLTSLHNLHKVTEGHKGRGSVVIDYGFSSGTKRPNNKIPLHTVCQEGHMDILHKLINVYECDRMVRDDNGVTPLHIAAACGREDIVRALIKQYNCPVDCTENNGWTPLMCASLQGHASTVKILASEYGANVKTRDNYNMTALFVASLVGRKDVLSVLIDDFGCSPETLVHNNKTSLHAACHGGHMDIVHKLICVYKSNRMARDDDGSTPLHIAAEHGREEIVRALITRYSCPVDCVDNDGFTPLMAASCMGHASTVELLASEFGADVKARDKHSLTSLHQAAFKGHMEVVTLLIEKFGCSLPSKGQAHSTPLHAACYGGQVDIVNKLIEKYNCDPMDRNSMGHNSLHLAVLGCDLVLVKELVVKHGCSVDSISSDGDTPLHLAAYTGQIDVIKLLTDVLGGFPSIKNNQGNTPMDCNPTEQLLTLQMSTCFVAIYQRGLRQWKKLCKKLLLLGESNGELADLINARSIYSLPQSRHKKNACFLNYVNKDLQDIWMCQYSSGAAYSSMLVRTLMSGNSYTAICCVDLDKATELVVNEVHSQVALIKEVIANSRKLRTNIIICGISSVKQYDHQSMDPIHEQAKKMITGSTRITIVDSFSMCLHTASPEVGITPVMRILKNTPKTNAPKMRYGSAYLLKLLLRDFRDVLCVTFTQLHKHLQSKQISTDDTYEDIWDILDELDSHHFIVVVGEKNNPETVMIIIHPLTIMDNLNNECNKSSDPLIKIGIVNQTFLSTSISTPAATSTIRTLLRRFGLPSIEYPFQKLTSDVALENTSDTFFFMPHIISDTRKSREWFLSLGNPFTIGLSLEVVEGSDLFSLEFQYSLLTKIAQYFIGLLNSNAELEGHVHNAVWQGGTIWALDDVEILAEVFENGRFINIVARSNLHYCLNCTNLVYEFGNIMLNSIRQHCNQVVYKVYVSNPVSLRIDTIPLPTNVPKFEASGVLWAIDNDRKYVQDSNDTILKVQELNWLQRLRHRCQVFAVEHVEVYNILKRVSGKWINIGRELRVPRNVLQALQDANLPPDQCCSKLIEEWLMYSGDEPSWYSLTEALRKLNMEEVVDEILTEWGPQVEVCAQLKDEEKRNYAITDGFLSTFAEVVKPHWNLLAPHITSTNNGLIEMSVLQQLQTWKKDKSPTYGDLRELLNQLIINPVITQEDNGHQDKSTPCGSGEVSSEEDIFEDAESWSEDSEMLDETKQKQLLDKALEEGHIKTGLDVLLFIGAAGSGKSHYKHLCLGLPPPEVRDSTELSEQPVRTMSLVRGAVEQMPQNRGRTECTSVQWREIHENQFIELIIKAISEGRVEKITDSAVKTKLPDIAIKRLPTFNMEDEVDSADRGTSMQREKVVQIQSESLEPSQMTPENKTVYQVERSVYVPYKSNFYDDLLRRLRSSTTSHTKRGKLLDVDWVYIVDSGGQPQFREMLPHLVQMATACVLILKLNEPLEGSNEVAFFQKGEELCKPYLSVLSNEQIVMQCSQIVDSQTNNCKLFVVGTHQDLEHECQSESRSYKNVKLLKLLQPQLGPNLEVYKTRDPVELIYPVNSKMPTERDYRVVEQFRRAIHNLARSKEKVDIPLYWFLLELLLHQLAANSGILSFEGCKEEAIRQLNISEEAFPTAVKFLAQKLGMIIYFPKVLPHIIFTPQALMSILSQIVKIRHLLNDNQPLPDECHGHSGEWLIFRNFGIMKITLLQTFSKFFSDIFTPNDFLIVMMKLLIVARISDDAFLFPSVLEELSPEGVKLIVDDLKSHGCLAPLVLCCSDSTVMGHTKENWLPVSFFTSLVARLLNVNKWVLCTDEMQNPTCLYRNCIQFTLPANQPGIVTLVDQFKHMEVYLQVDPDIEKRISKSVRTNIHYGLKIVQECLNYKKEIQIAFLCPEHNDSHIATLSWPDWGQRKWTCKSDHRISGKLTGKQLPWFQDNPGDPKLSVLANEVVAKLPAKWEAFAVQIELEYECIQEIKKNYPRNNQSCFTAVLHGWNIQRTVPFTWEKVIAVLRSPALQENRVAENIAKMFCPSFRK